MTVYGVKEDEWRKISSSTESVRRIDAKYKRLLQLLEKIAAEQADNVPELTFTVNQSDNTAILRSFAGETKIRLGWDASGDDLSGVAMFSSIKSGWAEPTTILKVYMPSFGGSAYLPLNDEQPVVMEAHRTGDFAYTVLMNALRKQVDLSNQ